MFNRKVFALTAALALEAAGLAQSPPAAPPSPAGPSAPRMLRGRSIMSTPALSKRGYLGVGVVEVTSERSKALKLPDESGVEVKHVDDDSPAAKAGLREGDIILELNGQKINTVDQFVKMVGDAGPGGKADMAVWRNNAKTSLSAKLDSRRVMALLPGGAMGNVENMVNPRELEDFFPGLVGGSPKVGFEGEMLTPQLAEFFGVKEGVLVRTVNANSAAQKAGLKAGDVVTKVNGTPVSSPREVSSLLHASRKTASVTVVRNHKEMTLNVEIADDRQPSPERLVL